MCENVTRQGAEEENESSVSALDDCFSSFPSPLPSLFFFLALDWLAEEVLSFSFGFGSSRLRLPVTFAADFSSCSSGPVVDGEEDDEEEDDEDDEEPDDEEEDAKE